MKNEADFKKVFKTSVKARKGFAISLAAPMLAGIPDLYCILPGYIPILLEAKWLGEINSVVFNRKIPYSPLQVHWMEECNKVNPFSAFGLIGFKRNGTVYAVLVPFHVKKIAYNFEEMFTYAVYSKKTKTFELDDVFFKKAHVPNVNFYNNYHRNETIPMNISLYDMEKEMELLLK